MKFISNKTYLYPVSLFIIATIIFIKTTAPDVTTGDSGELLSSVFSLGIGHPPGYPLYLILAKLFSYIAYIFYPILLLSGRNLFNIQDTFAFNVNFMSGVLTAFAAVVFYYMSVFVLSKILFTSDTEEDDNPSVLKKFIPEISFVSALSLPFINLIWSQSTNSEVYTLNLLLLTINIFLLLKFYISKNIKLIYLFSFLYGLNIVAHQTSAIFAPLFAVWIIYNKKDILKEYKTLLISFSLFILGLSVYFYLPIRSSVHPFLDWGNTSNLKNFIYHILRKQYGAVVRKPQSTTILQAPRSIPMFVKQTIEFFKLLISNITIPFIIVISAGIIRLYKKNKKILYYIISLFLFYSFIMIYITNFKLAKLSIYVNEIFFIPSILLLAIFIPVGITYILEYNNKFIKYIIILPLFMILYNYFPNDKSNNCIVAEYTKNILKTTSKNNFLFVMGDNTTFPVSYYYYVKNIRPDLFIIDEFGFVFQDMFRLTNLKPPLPPSTHKAIRDKITKKLITSSKKTLYFTYPLQDNEIPQGKKFNKYGLIYALNSTTNKQILPYYTLFSYNLKSIDDKKIYKDLMDRDLAGIIYMNLGDYLNSIGDTILANKYSLKSRFVKKSEYASKRIHYNTALELKKQGDINGAVKELLEALRIDKDYAKAHALLGNIYSDMGKIKESIYEYLQEIKAEPNNSKAWNNLGVEYNKIRDKLNAFKSFKKAIELNPNSYEAYNNLAVVLEDFKKYNDAAALYQKAIQIKPDYKDAYYNLGTLLLNANKLNEAYKYLSNAVKIYPGYADAYYNIGILYQKKKQYRAAIPYFEKAVKYKSNFDTGYFNIGVCYLWLKNYETAETYFKKAIDLNPKSYIAYKHLGNTYYFLKNMKKAYKAWKKAYELNPKDKELENNIRVLESKK